ncbi:MAG: universal stress protein [Flavobacteriaceae bacterium]|nr:universal stress protein [Flavobacteriaceae bacterium]
MKTILVPVGSTENGITNLKYAVNFASISGATVYLINIYKEFSKAGGMGKITQQALEDNQQQLDEVVAAVDCKGVEVIAKAIKGDPFEGISRISKQLNIDLMMVSPQSIEIEDEVYLGPITGKLVKQTDIPMLVIPKNYIFRKIETILLAFKRGHFEKEGVLDPLKDLAHSFSSKINLLQVKTPDMANEASSIDAHLQAISSSTTTSENATIYQGVLEHFQQSQPDMLCVLRRKRGFFQKLWEKNAVKKQEFYTTKPLLILRGQE